MSFKFHKERDIYFKQQYENATNYIIPFLDIEIGDKQDISVLEIGCGEGGILKAFLKKGYKVTGVDLAENKIEKANKFFEKEIAQERALFIFNDIYNVNIEKDLGSRFDLIILKDTLEHIHDQKRLLEYIKDFLKPDGEVFLAFPPWQMPFGGHQQMCDNKFASMLPYIHLFPNFFYVGILKLFGEKKSKQNALLEVKETGISIERFENIIHLLGYKIEKRLFYFINPNYKVKFNMKPRKLYSLFSKIPYLRNFFTTTCFYVISNKKLNID